MTRAEKRIVPLLGILLICLSGCGLILDWMASDRFVLENEFDPDVATYQIQFTVGPLLSGNTPSEDVLIIYPGSGATETHFVRTTTFPWTSTPETFVFSDTVYLTVSYAGTTPIWLQMKIDKDSMLLDDWIDIGNNTPVNQTILVHLNQ